MGSADLDRRRFLLTSSAGLLGSAGWMGSAAGAPAWSAALSTGESASLGYCSEDLDASGVTGLPGRLVAAERLPAGDTALLTTGVRILVRGLEGDVEMLRGVGVRDVALKVRFPGGHDFLAWSYGSDPVNQCGSECEFDVPIDPDGLEITTEIGVTPIFGRYRAEPLDVGYRLVTGSDRGVAKLRVGSYFIPLRPDSSGSWRTGGFLRHDEPGLVVSVRPRV